MSDYARRRMPVHLGTARDEPDSYVSLVSCRRCGALLDPREDSEPHERWHGWLTRLRDAVAEPDELPDELRDAWRVATADDRARAELDTASYDLGVLLATSWELQRTVATLVVAHDVRGEGRTERLDELCSDLVQLVESMVVNAGDGAQRVRALVDALRAVQQ